MATDHLGRELDSGSEAQTVTQFAVEQGTLDGSDEAVQATVEDEKRRESEARERAERVQQALTPDTSEEQPATGTSTTEERQA